MTAPLADPVRPVQVVVAYDFSPIADEAMRQALDLVCRSPGYILHVIAVIDPRGGMAIAVTSNVTYDYADRIQRTVTERITGMLSGRDRASEVAFFVHTRIGQAADEVLTLTRLLGASVVFVGSHGKTDAERILLGSVSERIIREARCTVVVARLHR